MWRFFSAGGVRVRDTAVPSRHAEQAPRGLQVPDVQPAALPSGLGGGSLCPFLKVLGAVGTYSKQGMGSAAGPESTMHTWDPPPASEWTLGPKVTSPFVIKQGHPGL